MNITTTKRQTIHYKKPMLDRLVIGTKPRHHFDQNSEVEKGYTPVPSGEIRDSEQKVWASQPVRAADGQVRFREVSKQIDLTPRSPVRYGLQYGVVGALPGALVGGLAANAWASAPNAGLQGALLGAVVVGGLAGALGAASVHGEKTELVWDTHKVYEHEMKGHHEMVGLGEKNGERGFFHRFVPDVKSEVVAEYKTPKVIRYKGEKPGEEPELVSRLWPEAQLKQEPEVPNRKVDVTVSYDASVTRSKYMGSMPRDHWSYSSWSDGYRECGPGGCNTGGQSVYRSVPVYEPDEQPRVQSSNKRLTEEASSISGTALSYGAIGAIAGAGLGALASNLFGITTPTVGASLGGALGAAGGAVVGANFASDDRVRVEWREQGIFEKKMGGYTERVRRRYVTRCRQEYNSRTEEWEQRCRQEPEGWHHDFYASVDRWPVGNHVVPVIVHYSAKEEGQATG